MEPDKDLSSADQPNDANTAPEQNAPSASSEPPVDNDAITTDDAQPENTPDESQSATSDVDLAASEPAAEPTSTAPMTDVAPPQQTAPTSVAEPGVPAAPAFESTTASTEDPAAPPHIVTGGVDSPVSATVMSSSVGAPVDSSKPKRHLKWVIAAIIVLVIVLAGGYTFAFYLPNTPSNVYKSGLTNTGKAADKLVDYMQQEQSKAYKSVSFNGKVNVKSGSGSGDATLSGAFDKSGNGTLSAKIDVLGEHVQVNGRSVVAKGNTTPDLYLQVAGVKSFLDGYGLGSLDSLDGQWISIDHTLVDTYEKNLTGSLGTQTNQYPTPSEVTSTIASVQTVNKQYLFTTDSSKAVLTNQKFLAKETKDGRSVDHYKVGYSKAHLQAYIAAVKTTLDASPLNDWSKKANDGKSMSEFMDWSDLEKSVKNAKSDYTFDVWIDTKTKLINSIQFTDPSDSSTKFTVGQNYTGGSKYPLSVSVSGKDGTGSGTMTLNVTVDTDIHAYTGELALHTTGTDAVDVSGSFTLTPGANTVQVTAPKNAKSFNDLIAELGFPASTTSEEAPGSTAALLL